MSALCEAIYEAIDACNHERLESLISAGGVFPSIPLHEDYEETPLHRAVSCADEQALQLLLDRLHPSDLKTWLETQDANGLTPLTQAVRQKSVFMFEQLLAAGADAHVLSAVSNGDSPMQWACFKKNVVLVRRLLELGVDVHQVDGSGCGLGFYVAGNLLSEQSHDCALLLRLLADCGLDLSSPSADGQSLLTHVCVSDLIEPFDVVVELGRYSPEQIDESVFNAGSRKIAEVVASRRGAAVIGDAMEGAFSEADDAVSKPSSRMGLSL